MKALSVLGTSSNSGKSWMTTALCAALRRRGMRVAPFKAQNMSNNSYVTLDDGEIGRAQAVQAEACGFVPCVEMNPILLKPSGLAGSQLIVMGKARQHLNAASYYQCVEDLWPVVKEALEYWKTKCDVLILEGAGSPVELNLMDRDIVNLRPIEYLQGRWLLVSNIERGGVFAQIVGTWNLLPERLREQGIGVIVNQFRGDHTLFSNAESYLSEHIPLPYLGVVPYRAQLQPESEDSLCSEAEASGDGEMIAWIRFPHLSNSQDSQPWRMDKGVAIRWVANPSDLKSAKAIVLPGSKNTLADLAWMRANGLAQAIIAAAEQGIPILGICGGYQMLGQSLTDEEGYAGTQGRAEGLNLLPIQTNFYKTKSVQQVEAHWNGDQWMVYEIHMGQTIKSDPLPCLLYIKEGDRLVEEGCRKRNVWGTYLHGLFESSALRGEFARQAGFKNYSGSSVSWRTHQQTIYDEMANLIEEHLCLDEVWRYVEN